MKIVDRADPNTSDHICRVRHCVNPLHIEPVTCLENLLRGVGIVAQAAAKTHCPQGHPYEGDNLVIGRDGFRRCRACIQVKNARAYWKNPERFRLAARRRYQLAGLEEKP